MNTLDCAVKRVLDSTIVTEGNKNLVEMSIKKVILEKIEEMNLKRVPDFFVDLLVLNKMKEIYAEEKESKLVLQRNLTLKELGFLNLLTEGISPKTENKALKIKEIDGYYLKQPTYGLLIDYAVKNNINIFGYDYYYDCENKSLNNQKCRDSMQAVNIKSIVEKNPNSKFIVFGGHGHTFYNYEDIKPMGQYLKEILPNMKIVSLNQLYYIDSFGEQESIFKLLNNKYKLDTPHLIKEENTYFDYTIIQSDKEIGYWYKAKTEILPQKIKINKNKGYYVEVISKLTNITVFKGKIEQIKNNQIYLPEGKYKIIYYDTNYNLLN